MKDASLEQIADIARKAVAGFPVAFRDAAQAVRLIVAELPERDMLADLGMEDPLELTGLYEGVPLTQKQMWDGIGEPDTVWLFRQPILAEWRERGDVGLEALIIHVTVHEFAHHFGWSDAEIARIGPWWL